RLRVRFPSRNNSARFDPRTERCDVDRVRGQGPPPPRLRCRCCNSSWVLQKGITCRFCVLDSSKMRNSTVILTACEPLLQMPHASVHVNRLVASDERARPIVV